ncbi:MAG: hypothetical protein WBE92_17620 [Steroidobacteraceae bacterium]
MTRRKNPGSEDPQIALERLIGRVLGEQPLQRAPRTLEARVLSRIELRARLHRPGAHSRAWRLAGLIGFVVSACLSSMLVLFAWGWLAAHLASARTSPFVAALTAGLRSTIGAFWTVGELTMQLYAAIPRDWLYGGLLLTSILYLTLFGLAAAAYRTLRAGSDAAEAPPP